LHLKLIGWDTRLVPAYACKPFNSQKKLYFTWLFLFYIRLLPSAVSRLGRGSVLNGIQTPVDLAQHSANDLGFKW
jgi:hypothetical protein